MKLKSSREFMYFSIKCSKFDIKIKFSTFVILSDQNYNMMTYKPN